MLRKRNAPRIISQNDGCGAPSGPGRWSFGNDGLEKHRNCPWGLASEGTIRPIAGLRVGGGDLNALVVVARKGDGPNRRAARSTSCRGSWAIRIADIDCDFDYRPSTAKVNTSLCNGLERVEVLMNSTAAVVEQH